MPAGLTRALNCRGSEVDSRVEVTRTRGRFVALRHLKSDRTEGAQDGFHGMHGRLTVKTSRKLKT